MTGDKTLSVLFLLYFVVLAAERIQSIVRIIIDPAMKLFSSSFDIYVESLALASIVLSVVMLLFFNKNMWLLLGGKDVSPDYGMMAMTATVLLFSGMVHTGHTVAPVQFVSYGLLILMMVLKTYDVAKESGNKAMLWYSLLYSVVFSMAIPVVYKSNMDKAGLFHAVEAIVSFVLVIAFGMMLRSVLTGKGENLLAVWPFLLMVAGDLVVIALRWKESVNSFVLVFSSLAIVVFALGKIIFRKA
ncbi:MAG: hypothetical protein ACI4S4_02630 [Candidatus Ornithospirochaeta sp.]